MKIGIFRGCGIGDAVQLTPLLQQIAADCPGAQIDFFTSENVKPILGRHPLLARCVTLSNDMLQRQGSPLGSWRVWHTVRQAGSWDLFLNLEGQWRRSMSFPWVRAGRSAGFVTPGRKPWRLFDCEMLVEADTRQHHGHVSQYYLELWQRLSGCEDRGFGYDIRYLQDPLYSPPAGLRSPYLCLAPGAGNFRAPGGVKRWPAAHWVALSLSLQEAGYSVVWLGIPEDRHFMEAGGAILTGHDFTGKLGLHDTVQILARSSGMVGNDSGLFHLAVGLDIPAVGFYGPTDPAHVGPFRGRRTLVLQEALPCVPCFKSECTVQDPALAHLARPYCMHLLTPGVVAPQVLKFFASVSPSLVAPFASTGT